jgi:mannose-6-phosphate isomerase-like protein (cupin superfamily)
LPGIPCCAGLPGHARLGFFFADLLVEVRVLSYMRARNCEEGSMKSIGRWCFAAGMAAVFSLACAPGLSHGAVFAQSHKPYSMQLLYTGTDGQAYVKNIEVAARPSGVVDLLPNSGIEIHRTQPGFSIGWHVERRRQYVITLSGRGEIDIAEGKKIILTPGTILLVENTTGKGHKTRVLGNQPWVALWVTLKDQTP